MNPVEPAPADDRPLWNAAQAAMARGDLRQADVLFLRHFRKARDDAAAQADFGVFCLQTGRPGGARYLLYRARALRPDDLEIRSHLGYAYLELQQFDLARSHFEAVLAGQPGHAQANFGLGLCLIAAKDFPAAARAFGKALAATPASAALPVLVRMGEACHEAGDDTQARALFERAQRLAPEQPALLLAHGRFLRETGDARQAMVLIDRCIRHDPDEPRLLLEKAGCLRLMGQPARALPWLDRLGRIAPTMPEGAEESGHCLVAMGKATEGHELWLRAIEGWIQAGDTASAETLLERLLAIDPRNAAGWNARGTLAAAGRLFNAAEAAWREAAACDPALLAPAASLALQLENANRLDEARAVAEQALSGIRAGEQQAAAANLLLALARVERRQGTPGRGLYLLERVETDGLTDAHSAAVAFERGKLLQALDRPAEAMAAFADGNVAAAREWRRTHPVDNQVIAGLDQMLDLAATGWLRQLRPVAGLSSHPPVAFLLGFPRSGTTLLNQVLDGHPSIRTMDELPPVSRMAEAFRDIPGGYQHALAEMDAIDVAWLRDAYFREVARHVELAPGQLLLDKFPTSTVLAGILHRVFPQARFVFALRHPCDVVLSCFMQGFQLSDTMFNFCTLADTVALYVRTMDFWQQLCEQLPLQVHVIRYEDVVDDFDGEVAALCAFLGVPWQDDLRDYPARALAREKIMTPSYEQVVRPIYREARYRWERYREFLEPFLPALQPWIERFGYAAAPAAPAG